MKIALIAVALAFSFTVANGFGKSAAPTESACGSETAASRLKDATRAVAFFERLRTAVGRDDRNAVAEMVHFPLRVNGKYRVKNRKEFLRFYARVFDPNVRKAIEWQRAECLFGNWQGFTIEGGYVWFEYTLKDSNFKVIAVNNDSWSRERKTNGIDNPLVGCC